METPDTTAHFTSGWRQLLDHPPIYNFWQLITGAEATKRKIIKAYCKPFMKAKILEIGCGTGTILKYIDKKIDVDYSGYDINPKYINFARRKYGNRGNFYCENVRQSSVRGENFDMVLAIAIFHHLDDIESKKAITMAWEKLKINGLLILSEPVWTNQQSSIEKYLMTKDRGQNIRTEEKYIELVKTKFSNISSYIVSDSHYIPWTVNIITAEK